jgi:hypothetical protein
MPRVNGVSNTRRQQEPEKIARPTQRCRKSECLSMQADKSGFVQYSMPVISQLVNSRD